ncbi:unnamed protein product [Absidia cylindrospora]
MTTRSSKKQRLMDRSTTSTIQLTNQQQANDNDKSPDRIRKRRQIRKIIVCYEPDSCDNDEWEANDPDFECSKRDIHEILDYTGNSIEHQADGSVIITPHPRYLPTEIIASIAHHLTTPRDLPPFPRIHQGDLFQCPLVIQRDLYHCSLINQQFYATVNPMLWRTPNLRNKRSMELLLAWLAGARQPRRERIRKLALIGNYWTDIHLAKLMPYLRGLEDLTIDQPNNNHNRTEISDASLTTLSRHCPKLRSFHVHGSYRLESSTFELLGQHAHQLRAFTLYETYPNPLNLLLAELPRLEDLTIYAKDWRHFPSTELKQIHQLTHLTIYNSDDIYGRSPGLALSHFNNDTMTGVAWPHLTHFTFLNGNSTTLNDAQLIPFLQSHPQLLCLKLRGGDYTDHALDAIPPLVSSLHLERNENITGAAARRLIQNKPRLTSVTFVACDYLIASAFPELPIMYQIKVELDQKLIDKIRQAAQG